MNPTEPILDAKVTDTLPHLPAEQIVLRSPLEVLQHALNMKLQPAELKEYFDLYRTMRADEAAQAYADAMNKCQAEMPGILRDKDNSRTGKKYASYESLNAIIRPVYTRHGFSLSFGEEPMPPELDLVRVYCDVNHRVGHRERYQGDFPRDGKSSQQGKSIMTALQGTGSTYSYARRYLAKNIFNLAETDEDNDGNSQPEGITEAQVGILHDLLKAKNISGNRFDAFLRWIFELKKEQPLDQERHRLTAMSQAQFKKACAQLEAAT